MEEEDGINADFSYLFKSIQSICGELTQKGQEYLLVTADPVSNSCIKIGSEKGRQFLDVNSELAINFFSFCFGAELIEEDSSSVDGIHDAHKELNTHLGDLNNSVNLKNGITENKSLINSSDKSQVGLNTQATSNKEHVGVDTQHVKTQNLELDLVTPSNTSVVQVHFIQEPLSDIGHKTQVKVGSNQDTEQHSTNYINITNLSSSNLENKNNLKVSPPAISKDLHDEPSLNSLLTVTETPEKRESWNDEDKITTCSADRDGKEMSVTRADTHAQGNVSDFDHDNGDEISEIVPEEAENMIVQISENNENFSDIRNKSNERTSLAQDDEIVTNIDSKVLHGVKSLANDKNSEKQIDDLKNSSKQTNKSQNDLPASKMKTRTGSRKVGSLEKKNKADKPMKMSKSTSLQTEKKADTTITGIQAVDEVSTNSSKPTCSICKAKFSRIHSLKGHMLIIHEIEVSMDDLQNVNVVKPNDDVKNVPSTKKKQSRKYSQMEVLVEEEIQLEQNSKKRHLDDEIFDIKNIKQEVIETETDIHVKERLVANKMQETTSQSYMIVLEENHDENVPVKEREAKKVQISYCDICEKFFQRELNLTIHNIRFHPTKIMQEFDVDLETATISIKKEIEQDDHRTCDTENGETDAQIENQQENIDATLQETDDELGGLDTLIDPLDRLSEIKENTQIQKHIRIEEVENKLLISCNNCEYSCEEFHQVLVHIARMHQEFSPDLDLMLSCFYGIKTYNKKCDECHKIFRYVASLWNHIVEEHPHSIDKSDKKKRLHHLIKKYRSKKSFVKCDICKEHFRSVRAYDKHMTKHPEVGKMYNCPTCGQAFSTKPNMKRHFKQIHLDEKRFQCDICGKAIKSKEALKYHRTTHEENKPRNFQCHICHKSLRKKETLQIHLRQHQGIKPYICEFCGMTFTQNGNRNKHVQLVHNDDRNLECNRCGKAFKLQEHLKRHYKMHLIRDGEIKPDKPFNCVYEGCKAWYTTSTQLKVHVMSKHTLERPFNCETCGKGFTTKDKMTRHAQTHLESPHNCDICHKKFSSRISLNMHYKTHQTIVAGEQFETVDNYETVIIPQEHGAPIKVQLAHSEPISVEPFKIGDTNEDERTFYIQTTKSDDGDSIQVDDNTILVDPSILESVLGATSEDQTVYYYVTDS